MLLVVSCKRWFSATGLVSQPILQDLGIRLRPCSGVYAYGNHIYSIGSAEGMFVYRRVPRFIDEYCLAVRGIHLPRGQSRQFLANLVVYAHTVSFFRDFPARSLSNLEFLKMDLPVISEKPGRRSHLFWFLVVCSPIFAFVQRREGVDTPTIVRLTKFHELNVSTGIRIHFRQS